MATKAERADRRSAKPASLAKEMIQTFLPKGGLVMEVFSGTGPFSLQASKMGSPIVAIDRDQAMVHNLEMALKLQNAKVSS